MPSAIPVKSQYKTVCKLHFIMRLSVLFLNRSHIYPGEIILYKMSALDWQIIINDFFIVIITREKYSHDRK